MDFVDLCKSMNIISALPEYTKPQKCRFNVFSLEPERFFPYAQIDVVEFPDDTGDRIREKTFRGPLHQQLREALLYIKNSIIQEQIIKVDGVAEPEDFLTYHLRQWRKPSQTPSTIRDTMYGNRCEVRVEPDRMILVSHPGADWSISQEGLRE